MAKKGPRPLYQLHVYILQRILGTKVLDYSHDNQLILGFGITTGLKISFSGAGNTIRIRQSAHVKNLEIHVTGSRSMLTIEVGVSITNSYVWLGGDNASISIGRESVLVHNAIYLTDNYSSLQIGFGCLIGQGAQIRLGDGHTLFNLQSGEIMNRGNHVFLGDRVWLAQDVLVLKNVAIGSNSVIGARSVVTKDIPPNSLAVGIPARVLKKDVSWRPERIDDLPLNWPDSFRSQQCL